MPSAPPLPGEPTMSATPRTATAIAIQLRRETLSPRAAQASSAATIGATACMKRTFATFAWLRATMKDPDATAVQTATPRPGSPIARTAATTPPRARHDDDAREEQEREDCTACELRRGVDRQLALEHARGRPGDRGEGDEELAAPPSLNRRARNRDRRHPRQSSRRRLSPDRPTHDGGAVGDATPRFSASRSTRDGSAWRRHPRARAASGSCEAWAAGRT